MKFTPMPRNDLWTREQTIIAFKLYCSIPFGQAHSRNKKVIEIANIIGRSPGAVARKLGNFGSLDPELAARGIVGLSNRSKLDEEIWLEFHQDWGKLVLISTELIAKKQGKTLSDIVDSDYQPEGKDIVRSVKQRLNQGFFRTSVLAAYQNTCCITGLTIPELHVASHIVPWSVDRKNRTNPSNGLCLNALHDKAFDKGLITISKDYKVVVSSKLSKEDAAVKSLLIKYHNKSIIKPHKFLPDLTFIEYHNDTVFKP